MGAFLYIRVWELSIACPGFGVLRVGSHSRSSVNASSTHESSASEKMERGRGSRDFFHFRDPFTGFGGAGHSLFSNFFENDPFDDPFFTDPFGSMFGGRLFQRTMFAPDLLGPSMFASSMLGSSMFATEVGPSRHMNNFLEYQEPQPSKSRGVVIKELSSDSEEGGEVKSSKEEKDNPRKHPRLGKEYVQEPDYDTEGSEERKRKHAHYVNEHNRSGRLHPQTETFSFQSSSVTYGGPSRAYYTSSTTRRMGGDGLMMEESREADSTTGRANHRISRGIHDKGHSVSRKLNSDGTVDTMQALHNLNEDDLAGFEEDWRGSARKHLPGCNQRFDTLQNGHLGGSHGGENGQPSRGWALPSVKSPPNPQRKKLHANSRLSSFNQSA